MFWSIPVWTLVILLKCLPEKRWVLHIKNEQKKISKGAKRQVKKDWKQSEKTRLIKNKEKEGIYV